MSASRGDIKAGAAYVELYVRNNRFTRGLRNAKQQLNQFGVDMQQIGRQMIVVSAGMLAPIALSAKTFADFDDKMREVKAVTGAAESGFEKLTNTAKELGRTTSFTAVEVAGLMAELGRAGFNTDEIDGMTASVLNLARATSTDATQASGIMAATLRQFSLGAGDASRVADVLTVAANKSFNTVEELGESMKFAGPVAADLGLSLEETAAILGTLGNLGIKGSLAGTAVRRIGLEAASSADALKKKFGVSFKDADGNALSLIDTMAKLQEATAGMGSADRAAALSDAFGLRGITAVSGLGSNSAGTRQLLDDLNNAKDASADTAKEMDKGLGGAFRILTSAIEGVKIALGGAIAKSLKGIVQTGTKFLGVMTEFIENNQSLVTTFAKVALGIGAAGAALLAVGLSASLAASLIGGVFSVISMATLAFGTMVGAMTLGFAALTSPITLIVLAIAGIGGAILTATGAWGPMMEAASSTVGRLKEIFGGMRDTVVDTFGGIKDAIMAGDLKLAGEIAITGLRLVVMQGMEALSSSIGGIWGDTLSTFVGQITGGDLSGAWNTVVLGMASVWESFANGMVTVFVDASKRVVTAWQAAVDATTRMILRSAKREQDGLEPNKTWSKIIGLEGNEFQRADELNKRFEELGFARQTDDIFSQIENGTYKSGLTGSSAGKAISALDAIQQVADESQRAAQEVLSNATSGGEASKSAARIDLENELAGMLARARYKRERANAEPFDGVSGEGFTASGGSVHKDAAGNPLTVAGGNAAPKTLVSNSALQLAASGRGGESPIVRAVKEQTQKQEQIAKQESVERAQILQATLDAGGIMLA